jgi:hypothetical protein
MGRFGPTEKTTATSAVTADETFAIPVERRCCCEATVGRNRRLASGDGLSFYGIHPMAPISPNAFWWLGVNHLAGSVFFASNI